MQIEINKVSQNDEERMVINLHILPKGNYANLIIYIMLFSFMSMILRK